MINEIYLHFRHTPLDRGEDTIRLVKVLSDLSAGGLVQCSIHHAKLVPEAVEGAVDVAEALQAEDPLLSTEPMPYICLSYTWGSPQDQSNILVNGKILTVRKNLECFLQVARTQLAFGLFWVDALCIDQANTEERDHQVQRMGTIFAKAKMLVTWLGDEATLESSMHILGLGEEQTQWEICRSFYERKYYKPAVQAYVSLASPPSTALISTQYLQDAQNSTFYTALAAHEYWRRAWVTQEIMLAKAIYVIAGNAILDYPSLVKATRSCPRINPESHFEQFTRLMLVQEDYFNRKHLATGRILISDSWMNNWGLVNLMHHFGDKCCTVRRDMVYSVLSLSREAETIKVNYQSPIIDMVRQVLEVCKDSVCLCAVAVLVRSLGGESFTDPETRLGTSTLFVDLPILAVSSNDIGPTARCRLCNSPLQPAGLSNGGLIFCLLTACKDSEGHLYTKRDPEGRNLLILGSFREGTPKVLGEIGTEIKIIEEDNSNNYLLKFSFSSLLNIVDGPHWGHTLRQRSCGNFWPDQDKPNKERLALSIV